MPDPAVVAAARTRKPDPVEAIKADVATRLAPQAGSVRGAATVDGAAHPPSAAVPPAPPTPAGVPASGSAAVDPDPGKPQVRSEERRGGQRWVRTVKSRWLADR